MTTLRRVAIIMAIYNGSEWLRAQLVTIKEQYGCDWHLFISDDGSTDDSLAVLEASGIDNTNVTVLEPAPPARSGCGNFLRALTKIDLNEFEFVSFADQDDIWSPEKLSRALTCMASGPYDGYSCNLIAFDNSKHSSWFIDKGGRERSFDYMFQGASAGCTYVFSRKVAQVICAKLKHIKIEDLGVRSHDWIVYATARSHSFRWYFDEFATVFYRQHENNVYGAMPKLRGLLARLQLIHAGWYRDNVLFLKHFIALTDNEQQIFDMISRMTLKDRVLLATRSREFRRNCRESVYLSLAILFGIF